MENDIYRHIGKRVKEERTRLGWTQEQLAEKADLHLSFIGQIERGINKPSLNSLKKIADALGVTAGGLLDEGGPPDKECPLGKKFSDLMAGYPVREQRALYDTFKILARKIRKISRK